MASPYRNVARGLGATRGSVRYLPGVGVWPLVLALFVAVPGAYYARRYHGPAVVTCTTMDARPSENKLCSSMDGHGLNRVNMISCRDTPRALETALTPDNPLTSPLITATEVEFPKMPVLPFEGMPGCEHKDKQQCVPGSSAAGSVTSGGVTIGPNVFINGRPVVNGKLFDNDPDPATASPAPTPPNPAGPAASSDTTDNITPDAARVLIEKCALTPDTSGPQRSVTVMITQRDYSRSALVVLGVFAIALLLMVRRRVRVTLDMTSGTVNIVERGFFLVKNRLAVPAAEVERAVVSIGPCGPLNGKRVELVMRGGPNVPLLGSFVLSISGVHARAAFAVSELLGRARFTSHTLAPNPKRSAFGLAAVLLGGAVTIAAPFGVHEWMHHAPKLRALPTDVTLARLGSSRDGSTIMTATLGSRRLVFVSDEEGSAVRAIDLPNATAPLGDSPDVLAFKTTSTPGAIVMDGHGRIFVALPRESAVAIFELPKGAVTLRETARIATEAEPVALSLTKDDASLIVVSNWGHALESFRTSTFARDFSVDLARSPRALTLSADDSEAVVAHDVGGYLSVVDLKTREVTSPSLIEGVGLRTTSQHRHRIVDARGHTRVAFTIERDVDRSPLIQDRIARVGDRFYVPGVLATTGDPNDTRWQYYGTMTALERFDLTVFRHGEDRGVPILPRVLKSEDSPSAGLGERECMLPRAVVADEAGEWLYLACEGPGQIYKIDIGLKNRCHVDGAWGQPFLVADAPTGLALVEDDRTVLVWSEAAATLTVLPFDGGIATTSHWATIGFARARTPWRQWTHELARKPRDENAAKIARGRELFNATNDHRISAMTNGVACANCHIGGREDALVWPTPGGPRQTPMLAGRIIGTAPYGWTGEHQTLPEHLGKTFTRLGGSGLKGDDLDALVAYVESIPAPRFNVKDAAAVARGRTLFMSAETGCSGCHAGSTFTDMERHEVSSEAPADQQHDFDTPSLLFAGGSAPYFHDGRYKTLFDVLSKTNDTMGHTSQLTDAQRRDMVSYLESLGEPENQPPHARTTARRP